MENDSSKSLLIQLVSGVDPDKVAIKHLLSADVEGQRVSPVTGADGSRVPLLRPGFNPSGAYTVSFVYLNSGARFAKNGAYATLQKAGLVPA